MTDAVCQSEKEKHSALAVHPVQITDGIFDLWNSFDFSNLQVHV